MFTVWYFLLLLILVKFLSKIFSGIQHIPNPNNCQMYYRCVNGVRTSMTCSPGLMFDRIFGDCNLALKVQCETKNNICEPFRSLGYITVGDPLDCSRFFLDGKVNFSPSTEIRYFLVTIVVWMGMHSKQLVQLAYIIIRTSPLAKPSATFVRYFEVK